MVGKEDIKRIFAETTISDDSIDSWLETNSIEAEVLWFIGAGTKPLLLAGLEQEYEGVSRPELVRAAVESLAIMWFMIGWDAHKQYGG